jgi:phage-related protein
MAVQMPHANRISQGATKTPQINWLRAQYGDGYEQRALNGLNAVRMTYAISWNNLIPSIADEVESDLMDSLSSFLTWKGRSWFLDSYSTSEGQGVLITITASISEKF